MEGSRTARYLVFVALFLALGPISADDFFQKKLDSSALTEIEELHSRGIQSEADFKLLLGPKDTTLYRIMYFGSFEPHARAELELFSMLWQRFPLISEAYDEFTDYILQTALLEREYPIAIEILSTLTKDRFLYGMLLAETGDVERIEALLNSEAAMSSEERFRLSILLYLLRNQVAEARDLIESYRATNGLGKTDWVFIYEASASLGTIELFEEAAAKLGSSFFDSIFSLEPTALRILGVLGPFQYAEAEEPPENDSAVDPNQKVFILMASFSDRENAEYLVADLTMIGLESVEIIEFRRGSELFYRCGIEVTEAQLDSMMANLESKGFLGVPLRNY
jgi:hypothetical protein